MCWLVTSSKVSPCPLCEWVIRARLLSVPSPSLSFFHCIMGIWSLPHMLWGEAGFVPPGDSHTVEGCPRQEPCSTCESD